jgi:hypothetical protein
MDCYDKSRVKPGKVYIVNNLVNDRDSEIAVNRNKNFSKANRSKFDTKLQMLREEQVMF